ncbi:MAG: dihydrodipicolinate synthase family protein [Pirellulales bacterium]
MAHAPTAAKTPAGVIPVFQTPYRDDESIDYAVLEREIDWLFDNGADGIALAMVSEVLRLSTEERRELAAAACSLTRRRGSVVISVGAESTRLAVDLARHAQGCGADALMAIPPVATALDDAAALGYFSAIARAVDLPLIVQDASGYVGRPLPISLYAKLLAEFGQRILFKPEATPIGPRLTALREATGGAARVFEGTGGMALVDSFRRGIVGTIPGADLIRGIVALWQALTAGDEARAYQLSLPISALVTLQTSLDAFLAVEKYLLVKQGVFTNAHVRGPVGYVLDEETRQEVDRLYGLVMQAVDGASP